MLGSAGEIKLMAKGMAPEMLRKEKCAMPPMTTAVRSLFLREVPNAIRLLGEMKHNRVAPGGGGGTGGSGVVIVRYFPVSYGAGTVLLVK